MVSSEQAIYPLILGSLTNWNGVNFVDKPHYQLKTQFKPNQVRAKFESGENYISRLT